MKTVQEYLIECNLLDQVLNGIEKITLNQEYKDTVKDALCLWRMATISKTAYIAGRCCPSKKVIQLHNELLKPGREDDRDTTLLHEIAHLLVDFFWGRILSRKPSAHGKEWKYVTKLIGGTPARCHKFEYFNELKKAKANHKYVCMDCGWECFTTRKLKNIDRRHHKGCQHKENHGHLIYKTIKL